MKRHVCQHSFVALEIVEISPQEEMSVLLESRHRIPGADADSTFVVVNSDQRGFERVARHRVPSGREGGIEQEPMATHLDGIDPAHLPIRFQASAIRSARRSTPSSFTG